MASVRILKKSVNNLCFDLISECYVYAFFHRDADNAKVNETMEEILQLRNDMVIKINNPEFKNDKAKNRKYYAAITADMQKMVDTMDKIAAK
jgi:hypothetical protein